MAQSAPVTALPGTDAAAVTPSDTTVFPASTIYVGGAGNVAVMPAAQEGRPSPAAVTFTAPPVGSVLPVLASRVMATNTTATLLVRIG
jgi:hypothetical protein